jgi:salicylate hydroxylase
MLIGQTITVIGGGIGGLAAALAAARAGAQVTVLEQAAEIAEVGAGIQISPNGWAVLKALGLDGAVSEHAPRLTAVRLRDFRRGAEVFAMPLTRADRPFFAVHRADLIDILARACREAGVAVRLNTKVEAVRWRAPKRSSRSPRPRPSATGSPSPPTASTPPPAPRSTPRAAPSSPARSPGAPRSPMTGPCKRRRMSSWARAATSCATRSGRVGSSTSWRWRNATPGRRRAGTTPTIRRTCAAPSWISVPRSAPSSTGWRSVHLWGLFRHPVAPVWTQGQLALLGDAAHPTLPFLAQGANMALEDAWSLVAALTTDPDTADALGTYAELAPPRTARIVQAAEDNATNYHLRPGPWRFAAHGALRLAGRFAPHVVTGRFDWLHGHDVTRGG